jgi:hypothetical protein
VSIYVRANVSLRSGDRMRRVKGRSLPFGSGRLVRDDRTNERTTDPTSRNQV